MKKIIIVLFLFGVIFLNTTLPALADPIRIMAANITSDNKQSYDPEEGRRIFKGLNPDIVLIQEWNYQDNSTLAIREFVDEVFGEEFSFFREEDAQIPNGVISRFPIIESGEWNDDEVDNRDFAYAIIDVPGEINLSAVSVHFLTRNAPTRQREAEDLISEMDGVIPSEDYLVIGGDFNTNNHSEAALKSLNRVVVTTSPYPSDQEEKTGTNAKRVKPYDGVYVDLDLAPLEVPVKIGSESFPNGLVFDSRVYNPLNDVAPVQRNDSGAKNMQHMAVIRDFDLKISNNN